MNSYISTTHIEHNQRANIVESIGKDGVGTKMDNLIKRSHCIFQDGRYNGIKKECRMGNTRVTGLEPVIERVSNNAELIFEIFSHCTIAKETTNIIGISLDYSLEE